VPQKKSPFLLWGHTTRKWGIVKRERIQKSKSKSKSKSKFKFNFKIMLKIKN
jgi:hypothetical protein